MNKVVKHGLRYWIIMVFTILLVISSLLAAQDKPAQLYKKENYEEAMKQYDRILREHPDWEEAHFGKGASLYKLDQTEEAMKEFEQAISTKNPQQKSAVFYNMGNSLLKAQRSEESLPFYKRALELNPQDFDAKHNYELAKLMMQQQEHQQQNQQQQNQDQNQDQQQQQQQQNQDQQQEKQDQQEQQNQQQQQQQDQQQQEQQQARQDQKKEMEKQQAQEDAAQVLDALKDNEKKLMQERLKTKYSGIKKEKDW